MPARTIMPPMIPLVAALAIAASTLPSSAALAPNYQRARELVAVVNAAASAMPDHPITQVVHEAGLLYRVVAGPCAVEAQIVPEPTPGIAGPLKFRVELGEPQCEE